MSQFGILSSFDHTIHTWQNYKQRISQWFIANDIDDVTDSAAVKRRAILLSALSDGTYQLAADLALPKELTQVPYEDILALLDKHFTPKKCGFGERYKFYAATQHLDETYSQWAARLRGLTTHCGFLNVEEALRDRFVMGMQPGPEKDKLFARDLEELTLVKAVELAESVRSARQGAAASSSSSFQASAQGPVASEPLFKIATDKYARSETSGVKKDMCQVCGYKNHKTAQCRFTNYKCKKCNATGHLRRMCKKINFVGTGESNESDDDDASPSGLGAILSQIGSDGVERPVSFASRTLNTAEKRYSQIQKEATAIIFGVRRFHQYLYGRATPFILRTDHKPLLSIFGPHRGVPEVSANRLQRYAMFLSGYNYTIEYIRSADNSADYLSRASLPDNNNDDSELRRGYGHETGDNDSLVPIEDRASYVNFVIDDSLKWLHDVGESCFGPHASIPRPHRKTAPKELDRVDFC
ncbi:unnamed protein product [Arctia plantaginis]|uniref:Reverse transcriptase RNase H-like domain-containing protein n=1 Tax=Arctia plantaginis TaxID=874455 RepID=A0A8S1B954_ARCPL|nr:unnamed protein product [Arctia plantaginis]